jgi:hypothetical protein
MNVEQNEETVQLFHCSVWLSCQFESAVLHHSRLVKCKLAASGNLLTTSYPILCHLASLALIPANQVDLYENKFYIALNRRPKRSMQPVVPDSALIHCPYTTCATARRESTFQNLYNLSFTSTRCKFSPWTKKPAENHRNIMQTPPIQAYHDLKPYVRGEMHRKKDAKPLSKSFALPK